MKKSPLSTPSGSGGKHNYGWKTRGSNNRTGYGFNKSDGYQYTSPNEGRTQHDFIPLNISTPVSEQKSHDGNWYGSGGNRNQRNSYSGGFNHYRNNYHSTPKSNFNNSYSPYKHSGKKFQGRKKGYQRDGRKQLDISLYVDMKSFLEDPWAELSDKLNKSREAINDVSLLPQFSCIDPKDDSVSSSATDLDDSQFSQESRNESSVDVTLGLDDTHLSKQSKTESSIDLKLDDNKCSQESMNKSFSSTNDSVCENSDKADNNSHLHDSELNTVQETI